MFLDLPKTAVDTMQWNWSQFQPYYADLIARELSESTVAQWLADWTHVNDLIDERYNRLHLATTLNTADKTVQKTFTDFLDQIIPPASDADQQLKTKLLESGLEPKWFAIPLRNMRAEADLYREENVPLLTEPR